MINTGRIRTDSVEIGSDDGKVLISGGNIIIRGGGLEVYSTSDGTDNGVMIRGNKVFTNFIKNPDFDQTPNESTDWQLYSSATRYDATKKSIVIDTREAMEYTGIAQTIDIYHPRATFQAMFQSNTQTFVSKEKRYESFHHHEPIVAIP